MHIRRFSRCVFGAAAIGFAAMLSSCGSGPGSAMVAGIEGTGAHVAAVSAGPISRFGSIFVNGVEYATTGASVSIDGNPAVASSLQVGDVVLVHGSIDANGTTGTATEVDYDASVQGPISAVNAAQSTLTVLGQTVLIGPQTSLGADAGGTPPRSAFMPGALVEVSGFASSNGGIAATRVELKTQVSSYLITGVVTSVDPTALQFVLNGETVDFGGAAFSGFPVGTTLQAGDEVQVEAPPNAVSSTLVATRITLISGVSAASGAAGAVEGTIGTFSSPSDFEVEDTHVTTNAQTQYSNGTAAQLATGVEVNIQGSFDATGTLVASSVQFNVSNPILLQAPVDAVDPTTGTLSVLGVQITTDAETRYEDQSANPVTPFNLAALAVGDYVEIHGHLGSGNTVYASLLTREEASAEVQVRGTASAVAAPSLSVLGVAAITDSATQFSSSEESSISSSQFFSAATGGSTVDLVGTLSGGVLQVTSASLPGEAELGD